MSNQTTVNLLLWKDGKNANIQFLSSWKKLEKEDPKLYATIQQREGFVCQDHEYEYKVGVSRFGMWLSRRKLNSVTYASTEDKPKPINIPDMKETAADEKPPARPPMTDDDDDDDDVPLSKKEDLMLKAIQQLTHAIEILVYSNIANTEAERTIIRNRIRKDLIS